MKNFADTFRGYCITTITKDMQRRKYFDVHEVNQMDDYHTEVLMKQERYPGKMEIKVEKIFGISIA